MTSTDLAPVPTRQALAVEGRSAPQQVTGKLKAALHAMVWEGLKRDDAAAKAGLTVHGLREALKRPHVKAWYLRECDVLRTSGKARRIFRLEALSEQDDNKQAAINAIRALDQLEDEQHQRASGGAISTPGFVIIVNAAQSQPPTIEAKRLIDNENAE